MTAKSRAEELAERARHAQARRQADRDTPTGARVPRSTASVTPPREKDIRSTLDLPPAVHRDLQAWLGEAAARLGRGRVTKQEALEALVKRLLTDEVLAKRVLADLKDQ